MLSESKGLVIPTESNLAEKGLNTLFKVFKYLILLLYACFIKAVFLTIKHAATVASIVESATERVNEFSKMSEDANHGSNHYSPDPVDDTFYPDDHDEEDVTVLRQCEALVKEVKTARDAAKLRSLTFIQRCRIFMSNTFANEKFLASGKLEKPKAQFDAEEYMKDKSVNDDLFNSTANLPPMDAKMSAEFFKRAKSLKLWSEGIMNLEVEVEVGAGNVMNSVVEVDARNIMLSGDVLHDAATPQRKNEVKVESASTLNFQRDELVSKILNRSKRNDVEPLTKPIVRLPSWRHPSEVTGEVRSRSNGL